MLQVSKSITSSQLIDDESVAVKTVLFDEAYLFNSVHGLKVLFKGF